MARPDGVFASRCLFHAPYRATNLLFCLCHSKGKELILATGCWFKTFTDATAQRSELEIAQSQLEAWVNPSRVAGR